MVDYHGILQRKLHLLFPERAAREAIRDELEQYGREAHEREPDRVRLAVLRIAGSDPDAVATWVAVARRDYRDVLAAAEYPAQLAAPTWKLAAVERAALARSDFEQYRQWLEE